MTEDRPDSAGEPRALEEERRTKTAFLAHVRHELRTPLNAILGYSEMLLEDAESGRAPAGYVGDLQRIRESGRQALTLVNEILDARKIEAKAELDLQAFGAEIRHGLRTPLNTVIGYCELLVEDAKNAGQSAAVPDLQKIDTAGRRFLALIEDIVNISGTRPDAIEMDLDPGAASMIREVARAMTAPERAEPTEGGRLLVVDDNETNRDLLSRPLERQGHQVGCRRGRAPGAGAARARSRSTWCCSTS